MGAKVLGVIPARLASSRLPEKPLKDICGKTLVERVWAQAQTAETLSEVVVATDSTEIARVVEGFGGRALMTDENLQSGSERVMVAAEMLGERFDAVVNIQGDMPFIKGALIDAAVGLLLEREEFSMTTIATPLHTEEEFLNPNKVKVVVGENDQGLYFSRAPIPHSRDGERLEWEGQEIFGYRHLGLYVYRPEVKRVFDEPRLSSLERIECLEQLRALERGARIGVFVAPSELVEPFVEVDTPDDLERARELAKM